MRAFIDVVFDGPPGPDGCTFVEVEDERGRSIRVGEWVSRGHNLFALRITTKDFENPLAVAEHAHGGHGA